MKINLIHCVLLMVISAVAVVVWYEHNFEKQMAWMFIQFKHDDLYALKDAVYKVVMENEELKDAVFKDEKNYEKIQRCLGENFSHDFKLLCENHKE